MHDLSGCVTRITREPNFSPKFDAFGDAPLALCIQKLPVRLCTSFSCSQTFHKGLMVSLALRIQKLVSDPKGISYSQTFHKSLIKNCPSGYTPVFIPVFHSQTFHKGLMVSLALRIQKLVSDPKGSFYSIFCEKIVWENRKKSDHAIRTVSRFLGT